MITKALILSHAAAVGLTCTAVEVVPPAYNAAKARLVKPAEHRRSATKPNTHRKATAVPVCPPAGIATLGSLPDLSRPLVAMDSDFEDAVLSGSTMQSSARSPWGGGVQASAIGLVRPGGAGGVGTAPPAAGTSVATPTDEAPVSALPEPKSWLFMIAGVLLIGAMLRRRRAAPDLGAVA
ncbi:hypothetical protein [Sphingomonas echinoides]|uniref:hypothetical protein n=1 Tax=Sphingomonas echinoides TaxID=59803 RepID=UPI0024132663|nr:hypothetical protein [Sphingomonas echinoides]